MDPCFRLLKSLAACFGGLPLLVTPAGAEKRYDLALETNILINHPLHRPL
jgi:hypothetical protein